MWRCARRASAWSSATTVTRVPSFGIAALGQAPRLRFAGLPMGHEFSSPMRALLQVEAFRVIDRQAP